MASGDEGRRASGWEPYAMAFESLITGQVLAGVSTELRCTATCVYLWLDLKQGNDGWPVGGYRHIAKQIGMQERTVVKAIEDVLVPAGLVHVEREGRKKAKVSVIHNPSRRRFSHAASVGPVAHRYRHDRQEYSGESVHDMHEGVRDAPESPPDSVARHTTGSRSMNGSVGLIGSHLLRHVPAESLCVRCGGLVDVLVDGDFASEDFCSCPFDESTRGGSAW